MTSSLYAHQQAIVDEDPKRCGLFLGTGSGKTRTALTLASGRTLVICPKTQKDDGNWEREAEKLGSGLNLTVVSKETFRRDSAILARQRWDTVIVDEAHTCLGVTPATRQQRGVVRPKASQLYEALYAFVRGVHPERVYCLTATIMRSPMTVWAAAQVLGREDVVGDFYTFRARYYVQLPMPGRVVFAPKRGEAEKQELAEMVRKLGYVGRLEDYVDMPEQVFRTEYVTLTTEQKIRIKELHMEYPEPIVKNLKTHMVENGVLNGDEFSEKETFNNEKIDRILEYAIEFPRMVVFARYKAQITALEVALREGGKRVFVLTGDTKDRGEVLRNAQKAQDYVFICQSQISAGWELPDCPVAVFASLDFSLVNLVQAQGRISRINNPKRNLYIYLVTRGGVDEHVYKTVVHNKMDFHMAQYYK